MDIDRILASIEDHRRQWSAERSSWNVIAESRRQRRLRRLNTMIEDLTLYAALRPVRISSDRLNARVAGLEAKLVREMQWLQSHPLSDPPEVAIQTPDSRHLADGDYPRP